MTKEEFQEIMAKCVSKDLDKKELRAFAQKVAQSRNPYMICDFCEYVDAVDDPDIMPILQEAMEKIGDIVHLYEFAFLMADCERKCVNYLSLQDKIIASENPKLIAYCSEYVPTFDQRALAQGMIKYGNKKWLEHYIEAKGYHVGLENASEQERFAQETALRQKLDAEKERGYYIPEIVIDACPASETREDFARDTIATKNPYLINTLAENEATLYMNCPDDLKDYIKQFQDAIDEIGDILHSYEFGASVPGANVRQTENNAIESGMPKYMYYVGAYVEGADAGKMLRAIKKTGNQKYISKMEEHIAEAGIDLTNKIKE